MAKDRVRCLCVWCVLLLVVVLVCVFLVVYLRCVCSGGQFTHAAIAADSLRCSNIGRDVLMEGGSAVDAAIASLVCTALVNPQSMGLGGGAIFTIMDNKGKVKVISSRETVPKTSNLDLLKRCPEHFSLMTGPEWIGVPGELRGYARAHALYGKLKWSRLFEPNIKLARDGFPLPPYLANFLKYPEITNLVQNSSLCELFCDKNKRVLTVNDTLKFPKLATTLETIGREGAEAFYTGHIAKDLINDVKEAGGTLSLEDLRSFKVREDDAQSIRVREYDMFLPPLPAGGVLVSLILNIMQGFGLSPASSQGENRALTLHRYIEAVKFTNGQKGNIKDPEFHRHNVEFLTKMDFIDHLRKMIKNDATLPPSSYNITASGDRFGTTHISAIDQYGSAVSVTSTINHIFGSAVYSPNTGIILNNELADFCGRAGSFTAGEQPPSSMSPTILRSTQGDKLLVIGGSGGSMITSAMAQSIMNHLFLGKSLKDAIDEKLVFVDSQNSVKFEKGFDTDLIEQMKHRGHTVKSWKYFLNVVNAVERENGCITAVSDARKMGEAAGY
ncbi:glutathione hydrolase 5 proenzyme isoform X2 [Hoplias malabaricus]|uniref:glutathione hydrolase 5 proenzyme isoform X2 n=1 Tax=Hoplias malabaricus TaxID=27720 RepID=UPI003462E65D